MSALSDYRLLWNAAYVQRRPSRALDWSFVLAGVCSLVGAGAAFVRQDWLLGVRVGVAICVIVLQLLWTVHLAPGFELMNTPVNARLVPRMRRRMVEMTAAGWLVTGLCATLFPIWQVAPAVVLYMISIALGRSGNQFAGFLVIATAMSGTLLRELPPAVLAFLMSAQGFVCASVVVALFGAWAIRQMLPAGGDRHFSQRKAKVEAIERLESMGRKTADSAPKRMSSLYGFALRQAIRSRRPLRLMLHVLGPTAMVLVMLPTWIVLVLLGVGTHLLMQKYGVIGKDESWPMFAWACFLMITWVLQLAAITGWRTLMNGARTEQGLLRLAARSPSSGEWNRTLAAALAGQVASGVGMGAAAVLVLGLLTGLDRDGMFCAVSLASMLLMPGIASVLLDYSREQQVWSLPQGLLAFALAVVVLALHLALVPSVGALSWVLLTAYSNVLGALLAAYRWKKMQAAPVAFPTGRFA